MITFAISLVLLILGYIFYGKFIEKIVGVNANNLTPAYKLRDDVDYMPLPSWRVMLIQFLNIAGVGPILGVILGTLYGSASFLWIVFGSIFVGAVHDYMSGMISLREGGLSLSELHGKFLGKKVKVFSLIFMLLLLILVGAIFTTTPANLLQAIAPLPSGSYIYIIIIGVYYVFATLLPIDKIIGRIYPFFGACLIFMAVAFMIMLFVKNPDIPEVWEGLENKNPRASELPIFPMLFVTITCGALSGFHGTQSPLMARCLKNERYGLPVFYGSMIIEGCVALVWAAVASYFFFDSSEGIITTGKGMVSPTDVIYSVSRSWLGKVGGMVAILGVISASVTSGDTALRSARLVIADFFKIGQSKLSSRLAISASIFVVASLIIWYSISHKDSFELLWQHNGWANQTIACITIWTISVYLASRKKCYWIMLPFAAFMTSVSVSYILYDLHLNYLISCGVGVAVAIILVALFFIRKKKFAGKFLD